MSRMPPPPPPNSNSHFRGPPPPPEPPAYLTPDYVAGDQICAICKEWVGGITGYGDALGHAWHRLWKRHRFRHRTREERWLDAQRTHGRL